MYLYTQNEVPNFSSSKVSLTDRDTNPTEIISYPHTRMISRMPFSQRHTISVAHRSQKHLQSPENSFLFI